MTLFLHIFILLPLAGFIISLAAPSKKETLISWIAFSSVGLHLVSTVVFIMLWFFSGSPTLNIKDAILFETEGYSFFIDFCFDKISAVYLFVGSILTFLVTIYSRNYLHRESGYKRFFNTILFFYLGYNIVVLSGNLETLFVGWEILGLSSFLLIAFYRDRYLPVKNAVKVFSIYRVGDVGIILAMWLSHHLWHENITFMKLSNDALVNAHLQTHSLIGVFISIMILIAAAAKSAQLPFSSWLPRAMEGPTPSSAIFYGSLSVHLGVFILLKTFPFWEHQLSVRILIAVLGFLTSIIATGIARVQSSVKSQIAYASIAQIGLMFIEVSAGFVNLALIHFAGNAFLRTYQLLVSPSVVSYLIREQFYNFIPREKTIEDSLPKRIEYTFYMLCLKEWNLDSFMYRYLWNPLKWTGKRMNFFTIKFVVYIFVPAYAVGIFCVYHQHIVPEAIQKSFPVVFSMLGLAMVLKSFVERKNVLLGWTLIIMSHFWIALAISFNEQFTFEHVHLYLSGITVSGLLGYLCLHRLRNLEASLDLEQFHGYSVKYPKLGQLFLLACLGLAGFPITPTFVGEDLIFTHIHEDQAVLVFIVSMSFILDGLAIIRIYSRIFLGPHVKSVFNIAYRSS
jgi:NADH-quinone oxidoreductase subunit L